MQFYCTFVLVPGAHCCVVIPLAPNSTAAPAPMPFAPTAVVVVRWCFSVSVNSTQGAHNFFYCRAKFKFACFASCQLLLFMLQLCIPQAEHKLKAYTNQHRHYSYYYYHLSHLIECSYCNSIFNIYQTVAILCFQFVK